MFEDDSTRLRHMLDAAREALRFVSGRIRRDLDTDRMLTLALTKEVEIIGEAANHVSAAFRDSHPSIRWQSAMGMRNRLVHAYFVVDEDALWSTVVDDLPPLISELEKLIPDSA